MIGSRTIDYCCLFQIASLLSRLFTYGTPTPTKVSLRYFWMMNKNKNKERWCLFGRQGRSLRLPFGQWTLNPIDPDKVSGRSVQISGYRKPDLISCLFDHHNWVRKPCPYVVWVGTVDQISRVKDHKSVDFSLSMFKTNPTMNSSNCYSFLIKLDYSGFFYSVWQLNTRIFTQEPGRGTVEP